MFGRVEFLARLVHHKHGPLASIKTDGSLVVGLISWHVFLVWLVVSLIVHAILGRNLVRRLVRTDPAAAMVPSMN
jgi:hypothetical protein